ncbi:MAG: hypothetical protein LCH67_08975 [Bacteroidetes bacterium]|nr:hypothetical protein [Bacteroidota bacterium]
MLLYSEFLYQVYNYSGDFFNFLIFLLGIYAAINHKFFKMEYRLILYLIIGFLVFEISFYIFPLFKIHNTLFINHPYALFFLTLSGIFYQKIIDTKPVSILIFSTFLIYLAFNLYQVIYLSGFTESPKAFPLINFLLLILSIIIFKKMNSSPKIKEINTEPLFWFNLGFLIVSLFQIILQPIFSAITPISDDLAFIVGTVKNLSSPLMYTIWAIGIYKLTKTPFRPVASLWP